MGAVAPGLPSVSASPGGGADDTGAAAAVAECGAGGSACCAACGGVGGRPDSGAEESGVGETGAVDSGVGERDAVGRGTGERGAGAAKGCSLAGEGPGEEERGLAPAAARLSCVAGGADAAMAAPGAGDAMGRQPCPAHVRRRQRSECRKKEKEKRKKRAKGQEETAKE